MHCVGPFVTTTTGAWKAITTAKNELLNLCLWNICQSPLSRLTCRFHPVRRGRDSKVPTRFSIRSSSLPGLVLNQCRYCNFSNSVWACRQTGNAWSACCQTSEIPQMPLPWSSRSTARPVCGCARVWSALRRLGLQKSRRFKVLAQLIFVVPWNGWDQRVLMNARRTTGFLVSPGAFHREEHMGYGIVGNSNSKRCSVDAGRPEVDTRQHTGVLHLFDGG